MTEPTEPTPGAPAGTAQPQPTPTPATADPWAGFTWDGNVDGLPPDVAKVIRDARGEAAKSRTDAKATAAAEARQALLGDISKALGLKEDPPDPAQLMQELEGWRNAAWANSVELLVHRYAGSADVAGKLYDSVSFIRTLDDLIDLDPGSDEFEEQIKAKVQEAAAKFAPPSTGGQAPNGPRPDPSQGARNQGQSRPTSLGAAVAAHYAHR